MGLPDIIRRAVATVEGIAGPLRARVLLPRVTGRNAYGPTYGTPEPQLAMVEQVGQTVASQDGTEKLSTSKFTFFEPVVIHEGDRLTLNGVTTTVIKVEGLLDPDGVPYMAVALTGKP